MSRRFQKVGGSKPDVVTVSLCRLRGNPSGDVSGPVQSANASISVEITDRPLTAEQALMGGIRLSMQCLAVGIGKGLGASARAVSLSCSTSQLGSWPIVFVRRCGLAILRPSVREAELLRSTRPISAARRACPCAVPITTRWPYAVSWTVKSGSCRLFHVDKASGSNIQPIVLANLAREARLMTDEDYMYRKIGRKFAEHSAVKHYEKDYVRGDVTTSTVEGAFSIFKRGMRGVYQHCAGKHLQNCAEKHLHRYLAEFEFRYSNREAIGIDDRQRLLEVLKGISG